jgi:hypothetical protein
MIELASRGPLPNARTATSIRRAIQQSTEHEELAKRYSANPRIVAK